MKYTAHETPAPESKKKKKSSLPWFQIPGSSSIVFKAGREEDKSKMFVLLTADEGGSLVK